MKTIAFLLFFVSNCLAQTETNIVAISDWSKSVEVAGGAMLRGRILIFQEIEGESTLLSTKVYVEFEGCRDTTKFYFDPSEISSDLRDASDKPVLRTTQDRSAGSRSALWITLPRDARVRLRANGYFQINPREGGMAVAMPGTNYWFIKAGDTNDYYLSTTITLKPHADTKMETNPDSRVWSGTLSIPKMRIFLKKS